MVESGPSEPLTSKCDVLMSKSQNTGLEGKSAYSPTFLCCLLFFSQGLKAPSSLLFLLSSAFSNPVFVVTFCSLCPCYKLGWKNTANPSFIIHLHYQTTFSVSFGCSPLLCGAVWVLSHAAHLYWNAQLSHLWNGKNEPTSKHIFDT